MNVISVHFSLKKKQCVFEEINHPSTFHVSSPLDVHGRPRIIASLLHVSIRQNFVVVVAVVAFRNLFRLWSQR